MKAAFHIILTHPRIRFVFNRLISLSRLLLTSFFLGHQKSFPLTEEEYIYHLDNIADNLRYWGAVSTVRTSLEKTKEKPRIGKVGFLDLYMHLSTQQCGWAEAVMGVAQLNSTLDSCGFGWHDFERSISFHYPQWHLRTGLRLGRMNRFFFLFFFQNCCLLRGGWGGLGVASRRWRGSDSFSFCFCFLRTIWGEENEFCRHPGWVQINNRKILIVL